MLTYIYIDLLVRVLHFNINGLFSGNILQSPKKKQMMKVLYQLIFLLVFIVIIKSQIIPDWLRSNFIRSQTQRLINGGAGGIPGNSSTPYTASMTFPGGFSGTPSLNYGITTYQSMDFLEDERFEVTIVSLTSNSWTVGLQIYGPTLIWQFTIRYSAVDNLFPFHFNSFNNIPVNYGSTLSNISTSSSTTQTFTNTINYNTHATSIGSSYRQFSLPLTNSKVYLFLTTLYLTGTSDPVTANPLDLRITATIISTTSYTIVVTFSKNAIISKLHFSIAVVDLAHIENSGIYKFISDKVEYPESGGQYIFNAMSQTTFMIGFTEFSSLRVNNQIYFYVDISSVSGAYGARMSPSTPANSSISRYCYTIYYLKAWYCPQGTYLNHVTNYCETCFPNCNLCINTSTCIKCNSTGAYYLGALSQSCQYCNASLNMFINMTNLLCESCHPTNCILCQSLTTCTVCNNLAGYFINTTDKLCYFCVPSNCLTCLNLTFCDVCDKPNGYVVNPTTGQCEICTLLGCINCSNTQTCFQCNLTANYILPGPTCFQCSGGPGGLFANYPSATCEPCPISQCLECFSLTVCIHCDSIRSYYLLNDTCAYCDPFYDNYINATLDCQTCSIPYCTNCTSLTTCEECNETAGYFMNFTDMLCYFCVPSNCLTCLNLTYCDICDKSNGYVLNPATGHCQICTLIGCINCSTTVECFQCNLTGNFILLPQLVCFQCSGGPGGLFANQTTATCEPCTLFQCVECFSLTSCILCNASNYYYVHNDTCSYCDSFFDYYINATLDCQACSIPYCTNCTSLTTCEECNETAGYFMNFTDMLCYFCVPSNCLTCLNLTYCDICDKQNGYVLNPATGQCEICTISGCTNCSTTIACYECNLTANYILLSSLLCFQCSGGPGGLFANQTTASCQPCAISQCIQCFSLTICISCNTTNAYYLNGVICSYCDSSLNMYVNSSLQCQLCSLDFCSNCSSLTTCVECNSTAYLVNSTDSLCYLCTLSNCLLCSTLTTCSVCDEDAGFFLNYTNFQCEFCFIQDCLECSTLTSCGLCNLTNNKGNDFTTPNASLCGDCNVSCVCDGYGLPWIAAAQMCSPICGDGLLRGEQCDDNNTDSYDGCSSMCRIEKYYVCDGQPSQCNRTLFITGQFLEIEKSGCNSFKIRVKIEDLSLSEIQENFFILNEGVEITNKQQVGEIIQVEADYTQDIAGQDILLQLNPGDLFNISYNPNSPALHYTKEQCQSSKKIQDMVKAVQIISYIILIASLLSCKIVGLELFGVLQLSYFTLSAHSFLNIYLAPLAKFGTFNGLNIAITQESTILPENYQKLNISSNFLNNCNIMLFLLLAELIVSFIIYMIGRLKKNQKLEYFGKRLLKQGFITLVLFNIFNISFSTAVHIKYADPSDNNYVISGVLMFFTVAAMIGAVFAMELTDKSDYGEFKSKFKRAWICKLYIPLTICYRMVLGFYTALKTDYQESTLLILAFSIAFLMFFGVNLPFNKAYQNYRAGLIHVTMAFTLLTTNYYRSMKSTTPLEIKGRIFNPALIELILIVLCMVLSFFVLMYEIYQLIKQFRASKQLTDSFNKTQQSIQNVL